jgi:CDP-glucose 4,6-dehydratase
VRLPNPAFWEGKRVFVTGAKGFKGRWLVLWLEKLGAVIETNDTIDIRDTGSLSILLQRFRPEIVIHLAAVSTVQEAFHDPIKTIDINAVGTISLLENLRYIKSVKAILNVTTDKVYHVEGIERGYNEYDALGGLEIYAVSKVCSELISRVYRWTYNLPLATARAGNVIGGGDFKRSRIVPNYYYAQIENKTLQVNKDAIRPWQYILDCLCGYLILCESLYDNENYKGAWNFASNEFESRSTQWLVDNLNTYFPKRIEYQLVDDRGFYETKRLKLTSGKAKTALDWVPKYDMEEMAYRTASWYINFMEGQSLDSLHEKEIDTYMEKP